MNPIPHSTATKKPSAISSVQDVGLTTSLFTAMTLGNGNLVIASPARVDCNPSIDDSDSKTTSPGNRCVSSPTRERTLLVRTIRYGV
ncbi:hypothetical protein PM082_013679 [Marasmius tenuissimus]|nr:hypothetical protein PM082_013679 [Marasmius tenuissimus]